jgi:tRNA threonylcarbamoyladenosine biosynthesis protein TsaB
MRLLAIDTSADLCSVGVAGGRAPVLCSAAVGRAHAERLMPMVEDAMSAAGLAFASLQRIAVTVGPGSFTGVRIGVAAARGLALATGAKAVGIGTLAVHAAAARRTNGAAPVVVAITAGRGEIYAQRFDANGEAEGDPQLALPAALTALVDRGAVVAGSGADALLEVAGVVALVIHRDASPSIAALLDLAERVPAQGSPPRPIYLRAPDAKPQAGAKVARR